MKKNHDTKNPLAELTLYRLAGHYTLLAGVVLEPCCHCEILIYCPAIAETRINN